MFEIYSVDLVLHLEIFFESLIDYISVNALTYIEKFFSQILQEFYL